MSNAKTPLTFAPSWNGEELGDDWVVANGLKASRPMTQGEQDAIVECYAKSITKTGRIVTVTKNGDKTTISVRSE